MWRFFWKTNKKELSNLIQILYYLSSKPTCSKIIKNYKTVTTAHKTNTGCFGGQGLVCTDHTSTKAALSTCLSSALHHTVFIHHCSFTVITLASQEIRTCESFKFNLVLQNHFGQSNSFAFPCNFRIHLSISVKQLAGILIKSILNLQSKLGTVLNLPIHEHRVFSSLM